MGQQVRIPQAEIKGFCLRWKIAEMALFGSAVRGDFSADSDVDVLVTFAQDAGWDLYDLMDMQDELESIFGRKVDLVEKDGLRNPFRRKSILEEARIIYGA